jgi:dipeptidyl aminopeptidase/acylaminoacyl peptidase
MATKKRAITIDDLYELTLVGDANISPDGERIAYVRRTIDKEKNDYLTSIWLWEAGQTRQYTAGDKDGSPRWSPDGKTLAFIAKRGDEGNARIMLLPVDGGEAIPLSDKDWEVSQITWSPDSTRIAFARGFKTNEFGVIKDPEAEDEAKAKDAKNKTKPPAPTKITERGIFKADGAGFMHERRQHICVIDVATKEVTQLTDGDFHEGSPAWSPDGNYVAFSSDHNDRWDTRLNSDIWEIASEGGEARQISPPDSAVANPVYSPDGKQLAFVGVRIDDESNVTGFTRLFICNRDGSGLTDVSRDVDLEIGGTGITDLKLDAAEGFYWSDSGIWFVVTEGGSSNIYRWNNGFKKVTDGRQEVRDFTLAGNAVAYTAADITHPAEMWVKRGTGKPEQLTHHSDAFLATVRVITPEPIDFKGAAGGTVHGWIMKPHGLASGKKAPLILYIHGGPQAAYGDSFFHEMQALTGLGFGILLVNPHGSSSYGEKWVSAIHGDWGNKDYEDFMKATDMAEKLPWVDETRIGVGGGSYGGYMSSWIIGHTDRFKAALIERCLVNMLSFVGTTDGGHTWWDYAWKATLEDDPMKLWKMSPIAYLKHMVTPSLVIHSENDHRCSVEQGEQIFTGLRTRGVPVRFLRFPEESHGLSRGGKPSRRIERMNEISRWFGKYLDNPVPDKT